jgi:2'-5' RNA ligase
VPRQKPSYAAKWEQFTHLDHTKDSLALDHRGLRRWLLMPYIAFIVPIEDPAVVGQVVEWQDALRPWLAYDPQPVDRLHITLHHVGGLRQRLWLLLPHTWRRAALAAIGERVRAALESLSSFEVRIGPLNALANVLIAEVQDDQECLRLLRVKLRRALPLRARPPSLWPYLPHITLGYWGEQPAAPIAETLQPFRKVAPVRLRITRVRLTVYTLGTPAPRRDMLHRAQEEIIAEFTLQG